MVICPWVQESKEAIGVGSPGAGVLGCLKWVLGTELGASSGTAHILNT